MNRPRVLASLLLVALLAPAVLVAGPRASDEERAVHLILQAQGLQEGSRHDEALRLLEEAWALFPHPKVLFFKARSLLALERLDEAAATYRLIRSNVRDLQPEKLREVDANLAECERRLKARAKPAPVPPPPAPVIVKKPEPPQVVVAATAPRPPLPGTSARRTWAFATLGTGAAALGTGLGFLGHYAVRQGESRPGYHLEGTGLDLGLGGGLVAVGVGLVTTAVVLFLLPTREEVPR